MELRRPGADEVAMATTSDQDVGMRAHAAAVTHLHACYAALDARDSGVTRDDVDAVDDPASAPFCGCEDCMVREVLHAAWPILSGEAAS